MANISSLAAAATTALSAISNLIMAIPNAGNVHGYQPQNPPNADGSPNTSDYLNPAFLFHYEGEQTIALESDITDHYVQDNTAVQDQIALKPEIVTTHGFIGELNDVVPPFLQPLATVADTLITVSAYTPKLSITATLAFDTAVSAYKLGQAAANAAISAFNTLTGGSTQNVIGSGGLATAQNQNQQQKAFTTFYQYWVKRTLFTVQTPWAVFQDMAIQKLRAVQSAETNVITDFEVTFKHIRTALVSTGTAASLASRLSAQASSLTNLGSTSGTPGPSVGSAVGAQQGSP